MERRSCIAVMIPQQPIAVHSVVNVKGCNVVQDDGTEDAANDFAERNMNMKASSLTRLMRANETV
jgi:hypothetical protein